MQANPELDQLFRTTGTLPAADQQPATTDDGQSDPNAWRLRTSQYAEDGSLQGAIFDSDNGLSAILSVTNGQPQVTTSTPDGAQWTSIYDSSDNLVSATGRNASGANWSEDGRNGTFTYNGQTFGGPQFTSSAGLTLGSTIGGILGGNSLAGRIAGATVLGTLGQSVGDALVRSGVGNALLGNGTLTSSMFDNAVSTTIADFGGNLGANAVGNIAGTFSSLLFGEAAHALELNGFAAGAFTTVGTSITSQLATNLGSQALTSLGVAGLDATFNPRVFVGNIGGAIGGYFGSYLAAEIVPARGPDAAIGGRIRGAIGSFIGNAVPVIGNFIGSFVGSILGTVIGGLFDHHYDPWSQEQVGAYNDVLTITYWNYNPAGIPNLFTDLSNTVASQANQVLALTRRDPNIMNITGLTSLNDLVFNHGRSSAEMNKRVTLVYRRGALASPRMNKRLTLVYSRRRRLRLQTHRRLPRRGRPQPLIVNAPHTRLIHRRERQSACG